MKIKGERRAEAMEEGLPGSAPSPLDVWRIRGALGGPARSRGRRGPDSMLAVYNDRVTYTFILDQEVASIHFDRGRREIFFKGHNIHNLSLTEAQLGALEMMKGILSGDSEAKSFLSDYSATLGRALADNNKGAPSPPGRPTAK